MKKRIKLKNKKKSPFFKILFYLCFVLFIAMSIFAFKNSFNNVNLNSNDLVMSMFYETNHNINYSYNRKNIINNLFKLVTNIRVDNPSSIISSNYYRLTDEEYSINSNYIEDPNPKSNKDNSLIYIYNTHQLEEYKKYNNSSYNITPNVLLASYVLREYLNNISVPSLVETSDVSEILRANNWAYYKSYDVTHMLINDAIKKNKSLKYFIDLHRDSLNYDLTTLKIGDKSYAKVLFIVGLENKDYKDNMSLMDKLCNNMNSKLNGICKGLYKKQGEGVNGIYNQDINKNVILIEVGGVDNSMEEVTRTLELFAEVLNNYIGDNNE